MSNKWNKYPKTKPTKPGLYLVTIEEVGIKPYVRLLAYSDYKWINSERMNMFEMYEVYKEVDGPDGSQVLQRVFRDEYIDATNDVIAWKELSKPYRGENK